MRRTVPTLSLLGSLILLPACTTPDPAARPAAGTDAAAHADDATTLEVLDLRHAAAHDLRAVLDDLLGGAARRDVEVAVDPRRNALLVRGTPADLERVRALVAALDTPAAD